MSLSDFFVDLKTLPQDGYGFVQLLFLGSVYGYLLMWASNMISDGSELLLLVPAWAGLVGSVILPILGAVPDGCIVLFSGMGPVEVVQEQLNVGIGALAGSTIMVLIIPWFLSIIGGRVNIVDGKPRYKAPKLDPPNFYHLTETGVVISPAVQKATFMMALTSVSYLLLQVPGLVYLHDAPSVQAAGERYWALLGLIFCIAFFAYYLYLQYVGTNEPEQHQVASRIEFIHKSIANGTISLAGVMTAELDRLEATGDIKRRSSFSYQEVGGSGENIPLQVATKPNNGRRSSTGGVEMSEGFYAKLEPLLRPFFSAYDHNNTGHLRQPDLLVVLKDMGESLTGEQLDAIFEEFDADGSKTIDFDEFVKGVAKYIYTHKEVMARYTEIRSPRPRQTAGSAAKHVVSTLPDIEESPEGEEEGEEEEEEEEEMPEDLKVMSPEEQQAAIKRRSFWMMGVGSAVVLLISDPMVDVLSELGVRTGIPAFYVAFVVAPLASNATELIAAYNYSLKKTPSSITVSLTTLEGAAVMNNTFVLGVFMMLIYVKGLVWEFFAETLTILLVQIAMICFAQKKVHTIFDAYCILALYPLSLALVAILEGMGWN